MYIYICIYIYIFTYIYIYVYVRFQQKRIDKAKKAMKFSCTASECLAIFPIMRHFLETVIQPQGLCSKATKAFIALALVIDQCHHGIQWRATSRSSLATAVHEANTSFPEAWPDATMIRKWHWHLHLPDSLARFGHLPSCFTCERKHKTITRFANRLLKTQSYEAHLLEQLLANEICQLKEPNVFPAVALLVKEKLANANEIAALAPFMSQPCKAAKISSVAKLFRGIHIHAGDAIIYSNGDGSSSWNLAEVLFHAHVFGMATTLVQLWTKHALEKHHVKCHIGSSTGLIPMDNMLFPVPYNKSNDEATATVLLPYSIYCQA